MVYFLHLIDLYGKCRCKYTVRPMDAMGMVGMVINLVVGFYLPIIKDFPLKLGGVDPPKKWELIDPGTG